MSVQIIIDSACDMSKAEADRQGLLFLPLTTHIDGEEYLDGVTITHEEFYQKLAACQSLPTTSQLTPFDFASAYEKALSLADEALVITLSGRLSGTAQNAQIAAQDYSGKVWVADSENATIGERILVDYAIRLRDQGLSAKEIATELFAAKRRICIFALVDTLEYLYKGGRLSRVSAVAGTVLHIKPVLTISNGELVVLGKARGSRRSHNYLNDAIMKSGGVDFSMPFMLAHSGMDGTVLKDYIEDSPELWGACADQLPVSVIGSTIGTHTGPGLIAVAFFRKNL